MTKMVGFQRDESSLWVQGSEDHDLCDCGETHPNADLQVRGDVRGCRRHREIAGGTLRRRLFEREGRETVLTVIGARARFETYWRASAFIRTQREYL
jgi:hypothetical protein